MNSILSSSAGRSPLGRSEADKTRDMFAKPAVTALVGALAANALILPAGDVAIPVMGFRIPKLAFVAGGLYLASLFGEVAHDYVLPNISKGDVWAGVSGLATPAAVGGANVGVWSLTAGAEPLSTVGIPSLFGVGVGSEILADYLYYNVISPMLG